MPKKVLSTLLLLVAFSAVFLSINSFFCQMIDNSTDDANILSLNNILKISQNSPARFGVENGDVRILFDEAHTTFVAGGFSPGPVSMMGGLLNTLGFQTDVNLNESLTEIDLSNYDVLVINFPQYELSSLEIDAIIEFVDTGGSLFLSGFSHSYPTYFLSSTLNPLSEQFNVTFIDAFQTPKIITTLADDPLLDFVSKIYIRDVGQFSIDAGIDMNILANVSTDSPAFAYRTFGEGKVFFSSTIDMFSNLKGPDTEDHFQFVANVFNWLGNEPITELSDPGWMNVPIRKEYTTTEVERSSYMMLTGDTHLHSSEGSSDSGEPIINQIERARECDYDFMSITDHQSDTPDLSWPVAQEYIESRNITDLEILYGVEGDTKSGHHHTCIGLTEIITPGQLHTPEEWPTVIDTYHQQGGLVFKAHPLNVLSTTFINYLNHLNESGIDGIELAGAGFFGEEEGGLGEQALIYPFTAGSDAHSSFNVNRTTFVVFAENNSKTAILDAILDRRTVIIDNFQTSGQVYYQKLLIGDQQWLDEFNYRNKTTREQFDVVKEIITNATTAGWNVTEANSLLANVKSALYNQNYDKAMRICNEILESIYSFEISGIKPSYQVLESINMSFSVGNPAESPMNFAIEADLINKDRKNLVDSSEVTISQGNIGEISLLIPGDLKRSGNYLLSVKLFLNNTVYSQKILINIVTDSTPPQIKITSPNTGEKYVFGDNVTITWEATDDLSGIFGFEIFLDNQLKASQTANSLILEDLVIGEYKIKVIAIDIVGNRAFAEVNITVEESITSTTTSEGTSLISTTSETVKSNTDTPGLSYFVLILSFIIFIKKKKD